MPGRTCSACKATSLSRSHREQPDGENVQAVQQVFTLIAGGHSSEGQALGGCDDSHVGFGADHAAHAHEASILHTPPKLQVAARCPLKKPGKLELPQRRRILRLNGQCAAWQARRLTGRLDPKLPLTP